MIPAVRSKIMQKNRFIRSLLLSFGLTTATCPAFGAETEYSLKVDAVAPLVSYWRSYIMEARIERDAWSAFVAPEWMARDYEIRDMTFDDLVRDASAEGLGIWAGVGYRPWKEDFLRGLRTGLGLRARKYDAQIASYKEESRTVEDVETFVTIVSRRREVTRSIGFSAEVAWTSFPFRGPEFLKKTIVEPYARMNVQSDRITTTAYEGGDRVPGTSSSREWTRDLRLGVFVGRVF